MEKVKLSERVRHPVAEAELLDRASRLKERMKEQDIDCVLAQSTTQYLGSALRWLTDFAAENAYPQSVLLTAEGIPHFISCGAESLPYPGRQLMRTDGVAYRTIPYFSSFAYTNSMEGLAIAGFLRENGVKTLGIAAMDLLQWNIYDCLTRELPELKIVDATALFDELRGQKSAAELAMLRANARIQDKVMGFLQAICLPGVREYEVRSQAVKALTDLGCEEHIVMMGSAPQGEAFGPAPSFVQGRVLQQGDALYIRLQTSGPGGLFTGVGRMFSVGCEPSGWMQKSMEAARAAQEQLISCLRPGTRANAVYEAYTSWLKVRGYAVPDGLFCFGQGVDHMERPDTSPDDGMALAENMCMAVNTAVVTDTLCGHLCDSVVIGPDGAARMHATPQTVFRT